MRLALELLKENRRHACLIVLLSLATGALSSALLATIARGVLVDSADARAGYALVFAAVCLAVLCCRYGHRHAVTLVTNRLEHRLRARFADIVFACSLRTLESRRASELIAVLTRDVEAVSGFVLSLPTLLSNVALLLGALVYLGFVAELHVLLASVALVATGMVLHARLTSVNMPVFGRIREHHARLVRAYQDLVFGIKELKMDRDAARRLFEGQIAPESAAVAQLNLRAVARHSMGLSIGQATLYLLLGGLVFLSPLMADTPAEVISTYVIVILFAIGPADSIANVHPLLAAARVAMEHIDQLQRELTATPDVHGSGASLALERLDLVDVTFEYSPGEGPARQGAALGPVSLTIQRGEILFITGGNGSGKTTLAKVLCGLYRAQSGSLRLDGQAVERDGLGAYRQLFSVSFGDSQVPAAALDPAIRDDARALQLASHLDLREVIERELRMDELSSGQRRRLALLAAIARRRAVYLFDEPAAFLDPQARRWLYRTLLPELHAAGATLIVITHDEQHFDAASRIVCLREGRIVSVTQPERSVRLQTRAP